MYLSQFERVALTIGIRLLTAICWYLSFQSISGSGKRDVRCTAFVSIWIVLSFFGRQPQFLSFLVAAAASVIEFQQGWNFGALCSQPKWWNPRQNCNWLELLMISHRSWMTWKKCENLTKNQDHAVEQTNAFWGSTEFGKQKKYKKEFTQLNTLKLYIRNWSRIEYMSTRMTWLWASCLYKMRRPNAMKLFSKQMMSCRERGGEGGTIHSSVPWNFSLSLELPAPRWLLHIRKSLVQNWDALLSP